MQDHEIIELYWQRNDRAIAATADKYGGYCYAISYNILHVSEDAEECTNDTYLGAWQSMPPKHSELLPAFLGKITCNLSLNLFKRYNADKSGGEQVELCLNELEDCVSGDESVEQALDEMVISESVERFLREQTEEKRNLFIKRYWYMYPIKDIVESSGYSESKIVSVLFRMRNELKIHLEREGIVL